MDFHQRETYVYIDVSNIRYACRYSLGFGIDFEKFYAYLRRKYPKLCEVRYYEGISRNDDEKLKVFKYLRKIGYIICALERKTYISKAKYKTFRCDKCGFSNRVRTVEKSVKLKSNVDVYLVADMLNQVAKSSGPINIVLVTCDGDYVEAIKSAIDLRPNIHFTVLATPRVKDRNCLSERLKLLSNEISQKNYILSNIDNIRNSLT